MKNLTITKSSSALLLFAIILLSSPVFVSGRPQQQLSPSSSSSSGPTTKRPSTTNGGLLDGIVEIVGQVGNQPPPKLLWTPDPSPECAAVNAGELVCCQASLAGDLPLVVYLAGLYGYQLNPNDVNGIYCDQFPIDQCPGVKLCCQVTALNPLLSLYCQDP